MPTRLRLLAGFLWAGEGGVVWLVIFVKDISGKSWPRLQLGSVMEDLMLTGSQCPSRLSHGGNVSGPNLKAGWTPVRNALWCCSGVQPSAGIGQYRATITSSPCLASSWGLSVHGYKELCSPSFPGGRKKSRRASHPSVRLLGQRRKFAVGKEEGRVCVTSSYKAVLCELLSTSEGEACD